MGDDLIEIPSEWGLSGQQELVIGSLMDTPGEFVGVPELCSGLYSEEHDKAPAKLRVLMQRCRELIAEISGHRVSGIVNRRGWGWRISRKDGALLRRLAGGQMSE